MSYTATGILHVKNDTQVITDRFKKRDFVLQISEQVNGNTYDQFVTFQLVQNKVEILDKFNLGERVTVSFNLNGKSYERDGKASYYNSLTAWQIKHATAGGEYKPNPHQQANSKPVDYNPAPESPDDLPF